MNVDKQSEKIATPTEAAEKFPSGNEEQRGNWLASGAFFEEFRAGRDLRVGRNGDTGLGPWPR